MVYSKKRHHEKNNLSHLSCIVLRHSKIILETGQDLAVIRAEKVQRKSSGNCSPTSPRDHVVENIFENGMFSASI